MPRSVGQSHARKDTTASSSVPVKMGCRWEFARHARNCSVNGLSSPQSPDLGGASRTGAAGDDSHMPGQVRRHAQLSRFSRHRMLCELGAPASSAVTEAKRSINTDRMTGSDDSGIAQRKIRDHHSRQSGRSCHSRSRLGALD